MEKENAITCGQCGCVLEEDQINEFDDEFYCEDCLDDITVVCSCCDERIRNSENRGTTNTPLCENCFENRYTACDQCGEIMPNDSAYYLDDDEDCPLCYECYQRASRNNSIHEYSYRPDPIFYGDGSRYFGVELEIDEGGKDRSNARSLLDIANGNDNHVYIKTDGSLDDGIEIVTHPMTLDYHLRQMPWQKIQQKALELGYYSHKAETCGLHVHVNRDSFGSTRDMQEDCISRVLFIVERFWTELLHFSRRTENQIRRWAARYGYKDCPKELMDHAKKSCSGRYACVNLTNFATIEFRIFRGTLKYNTLAATIELVDEICRLAINLSDEAVAQLSWPEFVACIDADKNTELITYLKERRLYINDPIYESEDD